MKCPDLSPEKIAAKIGGVAAHPAVNPYPTGLLQGTPGRAAILILFTCIQDEWQLIFIRRTNSPNDRHSGQVAFPGGRLQNEHEPPLQAALRETQEEIGVQPEIIQILGQLKDFMAISNYQVTPFVGVVQWPPSFRLQPEEVARVFTIPLLWLNDPQHHQIIPKSYPPHPTFPVIYFQPYDGELLWGFTAKVVLELLALLNT